MSLTVLIDDPIQKKKHNDVAYYFHSINTVLTNIFISFYWRSQQNAIQTPHYVTPISKDKYYLRNTCHIDSLCVQAKKTQHVERKSAYHTIKLKEKLLELSLGILTDAI